MSLQWDNPQPSIEQDLLTEFTLFTEDAYVQPSDLVLNPGQETAPANMKSIWDDWDDHIDPCDQTIEKISQRQLGPDEKKDLGHLASRLGNGLANVEQTLIEWKRKNEEQEEMTDLRIRLAEQSVNDLKVAQLQMVENLKKENAQMIKYLRQQ